LIIFIRGFIKGRTVFGGISVGLGIVREGLWGLIGLLLGFIVFGFGSLFIIRLFLLTSLLHLQSIYTSPTPTPSPALETPTSPPNFPSIFSSFTTPSPTFPDLNYTSLISEFIVPNYKYAFSVVLFIGIE
jgi:hypothetical protein